MTNIISIVNNQIKKAASKINIDKNTLSVLSKPMN